MISSLSWNTKRKFSTTVCIIHCRVYFIVSICRNILKTFWVSFYEEKQSEILQRFFLPKTLTDYQKKNGICSWVFKVYWKTYTIEISEYSTFTTFEEVHLSTKYQAPGINLHKISSLQASLKDVFFISIDLASLVNLIGSIRSFR